MKYSIDHKNSKISKLLADVRKWQVEVMKNDCTICYGRNSLVRCAACGWWGRCTPGKLYKNKI